MLDFWFGELENGIAKPSVRANWFASSADFDERCREFSAPLEAAANGQLNSWFDDPHGHLAYIVLCDQIPRNVYRGTAQAFAWDELALVAAKRGIENGIDQALSWDQRAFFYMPFEHSESAVDQHTCVGLFSRLRDEVPQAHRNTFGNNLRFAQKHRDIILAYGRFPHRNEVLGRISTEAEAEFAAAGDGFGQTTN